MNADRLLGLFEPISEAPDAIPRLRRFILDLAVRGKLVEQDPEDEPAGELLLEMEARFKRLRITKKQVPLEAKEIPFALPDRWQWTRLGQICEKTGSGSTPRGGKEAYGETGIPFLRSQNVYNDGLRLADVVFIDEQTHQRMAGTRVLPCDLLLNITGGSIGRCAKVPIDFQEANVSQHVAIIRVGMPGMEDFINALILSPYFQSFIDTSQTGAGRGGLPKNRMDAIPVALPPLAEQHRIVAKVDELMALCDQLEAARQQREQCRERLVAASLQRLNQPSNEPESFRSDARFALQVLPSFTSTPAQIKQLRQTILNLAVRGKLVEQDPEDEPAGELLRCIAADRSLLQKTRGRIRNDEIKPIPSDLVPYELPESWAWARFGDIMYSRDGERVPVSKDERSRRAKMYDYYGASGVIDKIDGFLFDKPLLLIGEDGANLLNRSTPIAFIARGKYWVNNHAHVLDGISEEFLRFIELTINAIDLAPYVTGTAQPKMNQAKMNSIPVALPPLAEQHRIVAKVDELMALCDQLEQQLSQAEQSRRGLLEAVLREALAGRLPERPEQSDAAL